MITVNTHGKTPSMSETQNQPFSPAPWEKDPMDLVHDVAPYFSNQILSGDTPANLT